MIQPPATYLQQNEAEYRRQVEQRLNRTVMAPVGSIVFVDQSTDPGDAPVFWKVTVEAGAFVFEQV